MSKKNYEIPQLEEFDKEVLDLDELPGTDSKITAVYYLHLIITKIIHCMSKDDTKLGLLQTRMLVELAEIIAEKDSKIPQDYKEQVQKYIESKEYKDSTPESRSNKLANHKLKLICGELFKQQTLIMPIKA